MVGYTRTIPQTAGMIFMRTDHTAGSPAFIRIRRTSMTTNSIVTAIPTADGRFVMAVATGQRGVTIGTARWDSAEEVEERARLVWPECSFVSPHAFGKLTGANLTTAKVVA